MKRLLGIHITPPDLAVEPPTRSVFSRIRTLLPALRITRPAHIEPPPLPTTTKSKASSISATQILSAHSVVGETPHRRFVPCGYPGTSARGRGCPPNDGRHRTTLCLSC